MRKLKLQVQISIDGFIAGANNEMDWMCLNWSPDLLEHVTQLTHSFDTILLGKHLAEGFIPHWTAVAADKSNPEHEAGLIFTNTPKIVFSNTLKEAPWPNTKLAKGNLIDEVTALKNQQGKDLICYGGGTFVSSLIKEQLIDELHLFVNPAAIGNGMPIFKELRATQAFTLIHAKTFDCGIVTLCYKPA